MNAFRRALWVPILAPLMACASAAGPAAVDEQPARENAARIVGGHLDTTTKGVVALAFAAHGQVAVFCSGSLLAPNLVLTARHCIAQIGDGTSEQVDCNATEFTATYNPQHIFVSTDSQPQASSHLYGVAEIRQVPGSTRVCGYDLALLILQGSGVPSSAALAIEPALDSATLKNALFSAVGYGLQDPADMQGTTAGSRMRFDGSSVYCVGGACPSAADAAADEFLGDSPVCSGDSGGPALDAKGRVFGVTSRGDEACTYALYSNVASWASFVRSTALDAAVAGGYTPPAWVNSTTSGTAGAGGAPAGSAGAGGKSSAGSSGASSTTSGGASGAPSSSGASGSSDPGNGGSGAGGSTNSAPPPLGPMSPTVDPTGAACQSKNDCPGTYQCYSATQTPPGMCVPSCSATRTTCPSSYTCNTALQYCEPVTPKVTKISGSASCALGTPRGSSNAGFISLIALGCVWLGRRRRQG